MSEGVLLRDIPIAVDRFQFVPRVETFFLTHAHADHTPGLTSTWNLGTIYCSDITKSIIQRKFPGIDSNCVVALEVGVTRSLSIEDGTVLFNVTPIDACHCPGSVMFLFEGYFGVILHTGDFCYQSEMLDHPAFVGKTIDLVYLDNTYNDSRYVFPSREASIKDIVQIAIEHSNDDIVVGIDSLGKEEILQELAHACKSLVVVNEDRWFLANLLGIEHLFTTSTGEGRVIVMPKQRVTADKIRQMDSAIAIKPSGWALDKKLDSKFVYNVAYSLHSDFVQLHEFIRRLKPRRILPIVPSCSTDFSVFQHLLDHSPTPPIVLPSVMKALSGPMSTEWKGIGAKKKKRVRREIITHVSSRHEPVTQIEYKEDKEVILTAPNDEDVDALLSLHATHTSPRVLVPETQHISTPKRSLPVSLNPRRLSTVPETPQIDEIESDSDVSTPHTPPPKKVAHKQRRPVSPTRISMLYAKYLSK